MAHTAEEFYQRQMEQIELPSGFCVSIRTVQAYELLGLGELPVPAVPTSDGAPRVFTREETEQLVYYTDFIIVRGTAEPAMHSTVDAQGEALRLPGKVHVRHLADPDYGALSTAILRRAGLLSEVATNVAAFREESVWAPGESLGG